MMQKKEFDKLARVIHFHMVDGDTTCGNHVVASMARGIADVCQESHDLFDRKRFYKACGLTALGYVPTPFNTPENF